MIERVPQLMINISVAAVKMFRRCYVKLKCWPQWPVHGGLALTAAVPWILAHALGMSLKAPRQGMMGQRLEAGNGSRFADGRITPKWLDP